MHELAESEGLLERLRNDRERALADAFTEHRERLRQIVDIRFDRRLRSRVDVDDVLQEAYIQAAQRVEHYLNDVSTSLFIWLRSITCQTLIDVHRRHLGAKMRDAGREVSIHGVYCPEATSACLSEILMGSFTSPSAAAIRDEVVDQLEAALEQMDVIDREVLLMRHFEDLTNGEVAQALELSPSGASARYTRAITRLNEILSTISGIQAGEPDGH